MEVSMSQILHVFPGARSNFAALFLAALSAWAPAHASDALLGYVDGLRAQGNGDLNVVGWACAHGVSSPLHVDLYVGGSFNNGGSLIGRLLGDPEDEPALASSCGVSRRALRPFTLITSVE